MAKHPRIPRVSIIAPFQGDESIFEETLLSVLENLPAGCEVIVPHNGTYSDHFDLEGEVSFAIARSSSLVDLIRDGFAKTKAQFVHVIAPGLIAGADWVSHGLDAFEQSHVAAVAPTVLTADGKSSAGWIETPGRLSKLNRSSVRDTVGGCDLNACFFRRTLLATLLEAVAPAMVDPVCVSYAFGCLLREAGWSVGTSGDSVLRATAALPASDDSTYERGRSLAAIRQSVCSTPTPLRITAMLQESFLGSSSIGESLGAAFAAGSAVPAMRRCIDASVVPTFDSEAHVLRMPNEARESRRAA